MKELLLSDIRKMLNGRLVLGTDKWHVRTAVQLTKNKKQIISSSRTLIFLMDAESIDLTGLNKVKPCAIIAQKKIDITKLPTDLEKLTIIEVDQIAEALSKFADYYRKMFHIPVVTITGTCGKTTTKEMLKWILEQDRNVHATIKNRNSPPRAFKYLLGIDDSTDVAVFEVGIARPGAANLQYGMFQPTIGVITTIGVDHLERFKTLEDYIREKAKIVKKLPADGTLILNADDKNTKKINLKNYKGKLIYFGMHKTCTFRARNIRYDKNGMLFTLLYNSKEYAAFVPGLGEHQVYNALAALAAAAEIGVGITNALERLKSFRNVERHLEVIERKDGTMIIDDTWNTNPTSIGAALQVLNEISGSRKKIIVLGDAQEIGDLGKDAFRQLGFQLAKMGIDLLITIGPLTKELALQFIKEGGAGQVCMLNENSTALELLRDIQPNSIVLMKGSMRDKSIAELVDRLKSNTNGQP